jgi:hypothetical protein
MIANSSGLCQVKEKKLFKLPTVHIATQRIENINHRDEKWSGKSLNTETGCNTHAQSLELVNIAINFHREPDSKTQADRTYFTVILLINSYKDYPQQGEHNHSSFFFKNQQSRIITRRTHRHNTNYTVQISNNSLRKTQTASNPEPKIDSKGRKNIMDGRVRNHTWKILHEEES